MGEFSPGDRVRYKVAPEPRKPLTVVAHSSVHDGCLILETDDGAVVLDRADKLELIPDTVTVTVDLPREQAEYVREQCGASPSFTAGALIHAAVTEALS